MDNDHHVFPAIATVEQVRDYLDWLVETGRGAYRLELRERYVAVVPRPENCCDDEAKVAFLIGVH